MIFMSDRVERILRAGLGHHEWDGKQFTLLQAFARMLESALQPADLSDEKLVQVRELRVALRGFGVTLEWIDNETNAGTIPFFNSGKKNFYSVNAVKAVIVGRAKLND